MWLILGMDIWVPNQEIYELSSIQIPDKTGFFVGGPKTKLKKMTHLSQKEREDEKFGKVS